MDVATAVVGQPTPWCLQHQFVLSSDHTFLAAAHLSSQVLSLAAQPLSDGCTGEVEAAAVEVVVGLVEVDVVTTVSLELTVLAAVRTAGPVEVVTLGLSSPGPQPSRPASQQRRWAPSGQETVLSQYAQQPLCTFVVYSAASSWSCRPRREPPGQNSWRGAPAKTRSTPSSSRGPVTATSTRNSDAPLKRSVRARCCSSCDKFVGSRSDKFVGDMAQVENPEVLAQRPPWLIRTTFNRESLLTK